MKICAGFQKRNPAQNLKNLKCKRIVGLAVVLYGLIVHINGVAAADDHHGSCNDEQEQDSAYPEYNSSSVFHFYSSSL